MVYKVTLPQQAVKDTLQLRKNAPKAFKKVNTLLKNLTCIIHKKIIKDFEL